MTFLLIGYKRAKLYSVERYLLYLCVPVLPEVQCTEQVRRSKVVPSVCPTAQGRNGRC